MAVENGSINWITMKQISEITGLKPTSINRYKDLFPELIQYRMKSGQMLEFNDKCIPAIRRIAMLYRDRSEGRRTTEKVREILFSEYNISMEETEYIEINATEEVATISPQEEHKELIPYNALLSLLQVQVERLTRVEDQNINMQKKQEEILENQHSMQQLMNRHLAILSDISRTKMEHRKKEWEWSKSSTWIKKIFGLNDNKNTTL
jgi:hypothetical protein